MVGLAIATPLGLILSFIGICASVGLSMILHAPKSLIETGIYVFNAVLIGIAASIFIKQVPAAVVVAIVGSLAGTLILHIFVKNQLTALTFPFVLLGWTIILTAKWFNKV